MDIVPHHIKIGSSKLKTELDNYYGSEAWQEKIAPYIAICDADGAAEDLGNNLVRDSFGTPDEIREPKIIQVSSNHCLFRKIIGNQE